MRWPETAAVPMADRKAFERIAMPHMETVYRAAVAMAGRRSDAEELTQTTFLKAMERFGSFKEGTHCKAWLLRILRNTWYDQLRHRGIVGPTADADELPLEAPDEAEETHWSDPEDLLQNFSDEQIIRALGELPEEQRLTLYLVEVESMSHEEAAEVLDVAVGTVKSRSSRAREALRGRLSAHARDLGYLGRRS